MGKKKVLIYGASGGLGSAICKEFDKNGFDIILSGRSLDKLKKIKKENGLNGEIRDFSITDEVDHTIFNDVDVVVNAAGMDIRCPLQEQSTEDIKNQLNLNLFGVINLTKSVLKEFTKKGHGQILHLGGFADGAWAMPYYTVDVATRSGIFSFIESINLELDTSDIAVQYFCPQPADTEAERPYHKLWKSQGVEVVPREKVAKDIFSAVEKSKRVTFQGGKINSYISTKLKYQFPNLFTKLILAPMGRQTMKYLDKLKENK